MQIRDFYSGNENIGTTESVTESGRRSVSQVTGYWRPLDGCDPYIGENGKISSEPEAKVEVTIYAEAVERTIQAIKEVHPYEEPVINAIPIWKTSFL